MNEDLYDFDLDLGKVLDVESNINTKIENSLKDKSSTPRAPVYLRNDCLVVYLTGADSLTFDGKRIYLSFNTINKIDVSKLNIKTLRALLERLKNPTTEESLQDKMKEKYRIDARKVTNKHLEQILKYEQRIKGAW